MVDKSRARRKQTFASTPDSCGLWRWVVIKRASAEGNRRAHDRTDIVRVGNLVENDQKPPYRQVSDSGRGRQRRWLPAARPGVRRRRPASRSISCGPTSSSGKGRFASSVDLKPHQRIARGLEAEMICRRAGLSSRRTHGMQSVQMRSLSAAARVPCKARPCAPAGRVCPSAAPAAGPRFSRLASRWAIGAAWRNGYRGWNRVCRCIVIFAHGALIRQLRGGAQSGRCRKPRTCLFSRAERVSWTARIRQPTGCTSSRSGRSCSVFVPDPC
jgi:hypothetical protein